MSTNRELTTAIHRYMSQPTSANSTSCLSSATDVSSQTLCDSILVARGLEESTIFYSAATVSDTELAEKFLFPLTTEQRLAVLNVKNSNSQETVLGFAVRNGYITVLLCILQYLDSNTAYKLLQAENKSGWTPVHEAACMEYTRLLDAMLNTMKVSERQEILTHANDNGDTPLHLAAYHGRTEIIKYTLAATVEDALVNWIISQVFACFNLAHADSRTSFRITVEDFRTKLLTKPNKQDHTSVSTAACMGHTKLLIQVLDMLDIKARYNVLGQAVGQSKTIMHLAAFYGHTATFKALLKLLSSHDHQHGLLYLENGVTIKDQAAGINHLLSIRDADGKTVLNETVCSGHLDMVKAVIDSMDTSYIAGMLKACTTSGNTPVHTACWLGKAEMVECMLTAADENQRFDILQMLNVVKQSALHGAALTGHTECIESVLRLVTAAKQQMLLSQRDKNGNIALALAAQNGHTETVQSLLTTFNALGIDDILLARNTNFQTAMHLAALHGHAETIVVALDTLGTEQRQRLMDLPDRNEMTFVDVARKHCPSDTVDSISSHYFSTERKPEENNNHPATPAMVSSCGSVQTGEEWSVPSAKPADVLEVPTSEDVSTPDNAVSTSQFEAVSSGDQSARPKTTLAARQQQPDNDFDVVTKKRPDKLVQKPPPHLRRSFITAANPAFLELQGLIDKKFSEAHSSLKSDDVVDDSQLQVAKYDTTKALEAWKLLVSRCTSWEQVHDELAKHPYYQEIRRALNETVIDDYMERKERRGRLGLTVSKLTQRLEEYERKFCFLQSRVYVAEQGINNLSLNPGNDADNDNVNEPKQPIRFTYMLSTSDSDDSGLSDAEERGYCDHSSSPILQMRMRAVKKQRIKNLYTDEQKVYRMTDKQRGRVLIINIEQFRTRGVLSDERKGSEFDYMNLQNLFRDLRFEIARSQPVLTNLTAEEIYREVQEETKNEKHEQMGIFVLVLMSFGIRGEKLLDVNKQPVDLVKIYELLSPANFPAMKDKPRLVIVQACSGEQVNDGASVTSVSPAISTTLVAHSTPDELSPSPNIPKANHDSTTLKGSQSILLSPTTAKITGCSTFDDLCVMKASSESYLATRSHSHGSWFIRILVATFYNHAHHRDVETLFKIIQDRVRKVSLSYPGAGDIGGNMPTCQCWFTNHKKLYFFPGYPPSGR